MNAPAVAIDRKAWSVLIVSTLAFTVCFMVWMMFGVIGIPIKKQLGLNATEFGLLTAMPVLTGSLIRVPLGIWTDRYGGRIVMTLLMAITVPAIWLMAYATTYWHFLVIGLFVGLAGGSFSVGTPYVARWFPKARQGMAMGVYGAGNSGSAVNKFVAPALLVAFGWTMVPQAYAAIMAGTVLLFWLFSHSDPQHLVPSNVKFSEQLKLLKDPKVLKYCQYYSIVFSGYVALALWMVQYYVGEYGLDIRLAALLAACFSLPGGVLRAIGGVLSDKYGAHKVTLWVMWVSWICLFLLSYPQTEFTVATIDGPKTFFIGLNVVAFTAIMAVLGVAWAFGKASVFKYISDDYQRGVHVDGVKNHAVLKQAGLTEAQVQDMYRVMAIANYEDRFVIPTTHREYAENAFNVRGGCGFSFGNGCSEGVTETSLFGSEKKRTIPIKATL